MASKRKIKEKRKRAQQRYKEFEQERLKHVTCKLLGKPYRKPQTNYELRRTAPWERIDVRR